MIQYFKLLPQKFGFVTTANFSEVKTKPNAAENLEFIFDVQPEDDIGGEGEFNLMTDRLVNALKPLEPSGIVFRQDNLKIRGNAHVQSATNFESWWIADVSGKAGRDDFGYEFGYLVVSERVMNVIKDFTLRWCQIELS